MTNNEQQAQDTRDKIAEDTLLMLSLLCEAQGFAKADVVRRVSERVSDLRYFTGRNANGKRNL